MIIGYLDAPNQIASHFMELITEGKIKTVYVRKPFSCPLCMTFWISLFYLCFHIHSFQDFILAVFLSVLNAFLTKSILYGIQVFERFISKIFAVLDRLISKM